MEARTSDFSELIQAEALEKEIDISEAPVFVPFNVGHKQQGPRISMPPAQSQVICVASGKGGTGKTTFTTNLAISLKSKGLRVLIVDADFGLANDHLLLGLTPQGDIGDVLSGRKDVREVLLEGPEGIHLLPGGVGSSDLSSLEDYDLRNLGREIGRLEPDYDIILFDLAAGISPQIMRFLKPAHEIILVTNPEVTALVDAYGLIKSLLSWNNHKSFELKIVLNRVKSREDSVASMQRLRQVVNKHLSSVKLNYMGYIPFDRYLLHSISIQEPVIMSHPRSQVVACIKAIAQRIQAQYRAWDRKQQFKSPVPSYFAKLEQQTYE